MGGCSDTGCGEGQMNQALIFVHQKGKNWLENFCARLLWRWRYPDPLYWAQDLAQIVRIDLSAIKDEAWPRIKAKDFYVRRVVVNAAIKFRARNQSLGTSIEPEEWAAVEDAGADPEEAFASGERIVWLREQLTDEERKLFDHFLMNGREGGFEEIASELGIKNAAARKRAERLRKRVMQLIGEGDTSPPEDRDAASDETSLVFLTDTQD